MSITKQALDLIQERGARVYGKWARDAISETEQEIMALRQEGASLRSKLSQAAAAAQKPAPQTAAVPTDKLLRDELANYKEKIVPTLEKELAETRGKLATAGMNVKVQKQPANSGFDFKDLWGKNDKPKDDKPKDDNPEPGSLQKAPHTPRQQHAAPLPSPRQGSKPLRPMSQVYSQILDESKLDTKLQAYDDGFLKGDSTDFYSLIKQPLFTSTARPTSRSSVNPGEDRHWTGAIK
jgi:hypothetical protein